MELHNTIAIVTGAASGIGYVTVCNLIKAGAKVAACDINEAGLKALEAELGCGPERFFYQHFDLTNEASIKKFVADAFQKLGPCNLLINNAGILRDGHLVKMEGQADYYALPTAQWRAVIETNLTAPMLMARETILRWLTLKIAPALIINVSSIAAKGNSGQSAYAASKAGLNALTQCWAKEFSTYGIRVVGLAPGLIETPMASSLNTSDFLEITKASHLGRAGKPEEVWKLIKTIIECEFMASQTYPIDGGNTL